MPPAGGAEMASSEESDATLAIETPPHAPVPPAKEDAAHDDDMLGINLPDRTEDALGLHDDDEAEPTAPRRYTSSTGQTFESCASACLLWFGSLSVPCACEHTR